MSAAPAPRDIADRDDIAALVADSYRRVFTDEVFGSIFVEIARVDLAARIAGSIGRRLRRQPTTELGTIHHQPPDQR